MDGMSCQELSCKACYYSTSHLLDFLNHVRKVHYELHASRMDLSCKVEQDLTSTNDPSLPEPNAISSETGVAISEQISNIKNSVSQSAMEQGSHSVATSVQTTSRSNFDQVSVKREAVESSGFHGVRKNVNNDKSLGDISQILNNDSYIKTEITASQSCDKESVKTTSLTASKSDMPIVFRGNKINNIAKTLKVSYSPDTKSVIDPRSGNFLCDQSKPCQVQFPMTDEVLISDTCQPSHNFCMPSDRECNPSYFVHRRNSVPVSLRHSTDKSHSTSAFNKNIFQPFPNTIDKQGFPNYASRYGGSNAAIHPHQLSFHPSDGSFSEGSSLFDSTGGFLPGFHALMCAGFVTMPRTQVLQSIKCDEKKWEYIQQTLHNAFRKFPYLTAQEVQVLSNLTELTCQQVKTLFAVARLQHGISWDQEEIQNARNYLRIPGNRFCGEG